MPKGDKNKGVHVIMLSNSLSTYNKKGLPDIRAVLKNYPFVDHLEGNSLERLYEQLKNFKGTSPQLLILNGGDGTIHSALTFLMNNKIFKTLPPIAILGGGRTNMIAKDLKTGEKASRALEKILECLSDEWCPTRTEERSLIKIDFGNGKTQYGMFFGGTGMVHVIRHCTQTVYKLGIKGKGAQIITVVAYFMSAIFSAKKPGDLAYSPPLTLRFDGNEKREGNFACLVTTSLHYLVFGSKAPQVSGKIPFLTLSPGFWPLLVAFTRGVLGTIENVKTNGVRLDYIKKVEIGGGYPFTLDGEIIENGEDIITVSVTKPIKFVSFI